MVLTPFGIIIFFNDIQPQYVDITDYQLFVVNAVEK